MAGIFLNTIVDYIFLNGVYGSFDIHLLVFSLNGSVTYHTTVLFVYEPKLWVKVANVVVVVDMVGVFKGTCRYCPLTQLRRWESGPNNAAL